MAKDNDNGLYLPLKINLSEWERSLAEADADLQKAMREFRSATKDLKLQYDVKIAGAKAAGNDLKVLELEERKLNQLYQTQLQAVNALNEAYKKSVAEKGASAKASQALAQQLVRESKELDKLKAQIDRKGLNIGKSLSDGLAAVSPEFARIRTATASLTAQMSSLGSSATAAAAAVAKVALPVGVVAAGVGGLKKLVDSYKETAEAAANANEEVYQLREVLNSSYEEAELLAGAARIDGVNLDSLNASINMLYKNLDAGNEKGKRALALLQQYGASITDLSGNRKNVIELFKELQKGYQNAEAMGKGRDFLTGLFGGSSDQFLHFIKGFDYYIAKAEEAKTATEREYQASHDLLDLKKQQAEAERALTASRGDAFVGGALEAQKVHNAGLKEQIRLYDEAKQSLQGYSTEMKNLALAEEGASLAWEKFKISLQIEGAKTFDSTWQSIKKLNDEYAKIRDAKPLDGALVVNPIERAIDWISKKISDVSAGEKQIAERTAHDAYMAEIEGMQNAINEQDRLREQEARNKEVQAKKEAEEEQKALDKQKQAREKFYQELRDLRATEYEKEIYHLEDRKKAWLDAGIAIVDAEQRFAEEKAQIDAKYFAKQQAEREKNLKASQEAYKKEIEEAKRARESAISDADSTLKNNLKLLRYIKKEQEAGTYSDDKAKEFANKLYMKQQGYKQSDIDFLKTFTVDKLKNIADAKSRLFADFASPITNNVTVNFDNTVVEDVQGIQKIAEAVAGIMTPVIQQALKGGTTYGWNTNNL